jgi:hypothetical protein
MGTQKISCKPKKGHPKEEYLSEKEAIACCVG